MRVLPFFLLALLIPFAYPDICADCHSLIYLTSYYNTTTNETTVFATLLYSEATHFQTLDMEELMKALKELENDPDWVPTANITEDEIPSFNLSALRDANIYFSFIDYTQVTPRRVNITGCYPAKTNENGTAVCKFVMKEVTGKEKACQNLEAKFNGLPDKGIREGSATLIICPVGCIPARSIGDAIAGVLADEGYKCLPLFLLSGLLLASLYLSGKNPLAMFDITTPRLPAAKKFQFVRTFVWKGWSEMRRALSTQAALLSRSTAGLVTKYAALLRKRSGTQMNLIERITKSKVSNDQKLTALRMLALGYKMKDIEKWLKRKVTDPELAKWNKDLKEIAKGKMGRFSTAEREALRLGADLTEAELAVRANIKAIEKQTSVGHRAGQIPFVHMVLDAVGGMRFQARWIRNGVKTAGVLALAPVVKKMAPKSKFMGWLRKRDPAKKKVGRLEDPEEKIKGMKELTAENMKKDLLFYLMHRIIDRKGLSEEERKRHEAKVSGILRDMRWNTDKKIMLLADYLKAEFNDREGTRLTGFLTRINSIVDPKRRLSELEMLKALYGLGESERGEFKSTNGTRGFDFKTGKMIGYGELVRILTDKEYLRQLTEGQHPTLVRYKDVKNFIELTIEDENRGLGFYQTKWDPKTGKLDFEYEKRPWGLKRKYFEPQPVIDWDRKVKAAKNICGLLADKIDGKTGKVMLTGIDAKGKKWIKVMDKSSIRDYLEGKKKVLIDDGTTGARENRKRIVTEREMSTALIQLLRTGSDKFKLDVAYDWKVSRFGMPPSNARLGLEFGPAGARMSVYDLLIGRYKHGTWAMEEKSMRKTGMRLLYNRLIDRLGGIEYGSDLYGAHPSMFKDAPRGFNPLRSFIDRNENIMKEYWRRMTREKRDPTNAELRRFAKSDQYKKFIKEGATFEKINKGMWVATPEGTFVPMYGPMMETTESDKQINSVLMIRGKDGRWLRHRPHSEEHIKLMNSKIGEYMEKGLSREDAKVRAESEILKMVPKSEYTAKYGARGAIFRGWMGLSRLADKFTVGTYTDSMKTMEDTMATTTLYTGRAFKLFRDVGMDKYEEIAGPMRYMPGLDEKGIEAREKRISEAVPKKDERLAEALRTFGHEWAPLAAIATTTITSRDARTQSTSYGIRQTFRGLSHTGQAMFSSPMTFVERSQVGGFIGAGVPGPSGRLLKTMSRLISIPYRAAALGMMVSYTPVLGVLTTARTPMEYLMGYPGGAYDKPDESVMRRPWEIPSMFARPFQMFDWEMLPYLHSKFSQVGQMNPLGELLAKRMPGEYVKKSPIQQMLGKVQDATIAAGAALRGGYYSEIGRSGTDKLMDGVRRQREVWPDVKYVSRQHTIPVAAGLAYSTFRFYTPLYPRVAEWIMNRDNLSHLATASDMIEKSAKVPIHRRGIEYSAVGSDPRSRNALGQLIESEQEFGGYSPIHYPTSIALSPAFIPWFAGGRVIGDAAASAVSKAAAYEIGASKGVTPTEGFTGDIKYGATPHTAPNVSYKKMFGERKLRSVLKEASAGAAHGLKEMIQGAAPRMGAPPLWDKAGRQLGFAQGLYTRIRGEVVQCPYCHAPMTRGAAHWCKETGREVHDTHFLTQMQMIRKVEEETRRKAIEEGLTKKQAASRAGEEMRKIREKQDEELWAARTPGRHWRTSMTEWGKICKAAAERWKKRRRGA